MTKRTLHAVAYVSDAVVLVTYLLAALNPGNLIWFHWANALGAAPLLLVEIKQKAYPVIPLTATFCVLGWVGVINHYL